MTPWPIHRQRTRADTGRMHRKPMSTSTRLSVISFVVPVPLPVVGVGTTIRAEPGVTIERIGDDVIVSWVNPPERGGSGVSTRTFNWHQAVWAEFIPEEPTATVAAKRTK